MCEGVFLSPNNQLMSIKHKLERGCITIKLMKEPLRGSLLGEMNFSHNITGVNLVYDLF